MVGLRPQLANGLHWLRFELEQSLSRARSNLEQYLEAPGDRQQLMMALQELRLVRGGVGIIECYGAQLLADEMIELLRELLEDRISQADEAFSALSGAALQLFDYLDLLGDGERDRALILQPLINELRLARGKPVLTEGDLLAYQLRAAEASQTRMADATPASRAVAQATARRELPGFQMSFLQWFRGQEPPVALQKLAAICARLSRTATEVAVRDFWGAASALAESLPPAATQSLDLKRLFGRAGTLLKVIADEGEPAASGQIGDAGYHLLLHVGRSPQPSERARELIDSYHLDTLLPDAEELEQVRRRLRGPSTTILDRVCEELRRDFAQIKDGIDLAVRTGGHASTELPAIGERLKRLAATLGVLGLPAPQQALLNQATALTAPSPSIKDWMDIATAILRVEVSIEEALFRAQGRYSTQPARSYADIEDDIPPSQDQRDAIRALLREAMVNLALLKTAVDNLLKSGETSGLAATPELLHEVAASLSMLNQPLAVDLLHALEGYATAAVLARLADNAAEAERFADAVAGVEMYLEALRDGLRSDGLLDDLAALIGRLIPLPKSVATRVSVADEASVIEEIEVPEPTLSFSAADLVKAGEWQAPADGSMSGVEIAAPARPVEVAKPAEVFKAPEPAPTPVKPTVTVQTDETDPEIRAVFVEEAAGVLENLQRLLPQFLRQPHESGLLSDLRRGFHTLKGSGRMVGAVRIGEVGWAIERMLNQCLAGALQVRAPVLDTLQQAVRLMPGVLANFRDGTSEHEDVAKLIERADELASGQVIEPDLLQVFREDARERLTAVGRWLEAQDLSEGGVLVPAELVRAFHTLRGAASVIEASTVGAVAGAIEGYLNAAQVGGQRLPPAALALLADAVVTLRGWTDGYAGPGAVRADARPWLERVDTLHRQMSPAAQGRRESVDPYSFSALEQVQAVENAYRAWAEAPAKRPDSITVQLDALAVAAARIGDTSSARVALELSKRAGLAPIIPDPSYFERSGDIIDTLFEGLDLFRSGGKLDVEPALAQIAALPTATLADDIDPQLLKIFLEEAAELLAELEHGIEVWHASPGRSETRDAMRRAAHTLKGSARMAKLDSVGLVAQKLEGTIAAVEHVGLPLRTSLKRMGAAVMALRRMLDDAARGIVPSPDAALAALEDGGSGSSMTATTATAPTQIEVPKFQFDTVPVLEPAIDFSISAPTPSEIAAEAVEPPIHFDMGNASGAPIDLVPMQTGLVEGTPEVAGLEVSAAELQRLESWAESGADVGSDANVIDVDYIEPSVAPSIASLPIETIIDGPGAEAATVDQAAQELAAELIVLPPASEPITQDWSLQPLADTALDAQIAAAPDLTLDLPVETADSPLEDDLLLLDVAVDDSIAPPAVSDADIIDLQLDAPVENLDEQIFVLEPVEESSAADSSALEAMAEAPVAPDFALVDAIDIAMPDEFASPSLAPELTASPEVFAPSLPPVVEPATFDTAVAVPEFVPPVAQTSVKPAWEAPAILKGPTPIPAGMPLPNRVVDDSDVADELVEIFLAEATELVEGLDDAFEAWQNGDEGDAVRDVQRLLHTLKGSARMVGFDNVGHLTHDFESRVNALLSRNEFPDPDTFKALNHEFDEIRTLLESIARGGSSVAEPVVVEPMVVEPPAPQPTVTPTYAPPAPVSFAEPAPFVPPIDNFATPEFAPKFAPEFTQQFIQEPAQEFVPPPVGPAATEDRKPATLPPPTPPSRLDADEAAPTPTPAWNSSLFWRPEEEPLGGGLGRRETARVPVEALETLLNEAGEVSIFRSRIEQQSTQLRTQLAEMSQTLTRVREQLRQMDIETEAQINARGLGPDKEAAEEPDRYGRDFDPLEMDRYSRMQELSRALAESIGDMASLHTTIDEVVAESESLLQQQSRIASELQQGLMGTLMVPFSRQVARLQRVVVQTTRQNHKQADIVFAGVEAELDRNVLERMTAPLEHLLRNAVVHGIELPSLREARGKPAKGEIRVSLRREGSHLMVEVADDGGGLDFAAIRSKAVQRGLMPANAQLPESELGRFIFEPGFSTARELTQDAGRGIGMDVVASEVKQLGGTVELSSEQGKGTRFRIRLPLTLAVSHALLVQVGGEAYAVPLTQIEGVARVPRGKGETWIDDDSLPLNYGGNQYKIGYLGDLVSIPRQLPQQVKSVIALLIKVGDGVGSERRMALVVDQLIGNREIVSKAVGPQISSVAGVSGATIMPDGRVVLILDVPAMLADLTLRQLRAEVMMPIQSDQRELILVVDDSVTMRRVAERLLTRHGFKVETAVDGMDAIGQLQATTPSVVLLDIEMPRVDGFEVAMFMRNNERLAQVPIIMITSRSGDKHRERARALNVDSYLIKPYQEDKLLAELDVVRRARGIIQ